MVVVVILSIVELVFVDRLCTCRRRRRQQQRHGTVVGNVDSDDPVPS